MSDTFTLEKIIDNLAARGGLSRRDARVLVEELLLGNMTIDQWGNAVTDAEGYWEDLRFPAQGINPAGSPSPATVDDTTFPGTLLFGDSTDQYIAGVAQLPHSWQRGSAVRPHIHWAKTTSASGTVAWRLKYVVADIGEAFEAYSAAQEGTLAVSDGNTAHKHALTSFPEIALADVGESSMILWQLYRDVSEDSYGASARLFELDFHFQTNKAGTKDEIPAD